MGYRLHHQLFRTREEAEAHQRTTRDLGQPGYSETYPLGVEGALIIWTPGATPAAGYKSIWEEFYG